MQQLEDPENIKKLKYRYLRLMDQHLEGGKLSFSNRNEIVAMFKQYMDDTDVFALHHVHHPEIEFSDPDHATGIWAFEDRYIFRTRKATSYGSGFYDDRYVKVDGAWKFAHSGHARVCEVQESLSDDFEFIQACDYNDWAKQD